MKEQVRTAAPFAGRSNSQPTSADVHLLIDRMPALLALIDTEERFRFVNKAYEEFFGRARGEIAGRTILEVDGAGHYAVAKQHIRRVLQGDRTAFTSSLKRVDGSVRDIEVAYSPYVDHNGQVAGFISLIRDVTDRTFMSEARARLAAIIDSSDDAIVSKTLDGIITSWNRSAERTFGYTEDEAIGQHITLIIPPERRSEEDDVLARLRRGEKIDHFETERRAKDGHPVYISLSVSPVRNAVGEIVGASKVARDITERKRAEAALRATEEYRRTVLDSMPECVMVLDRDGIVLDMNAAGLNMVGAGTADVVLGRCIYPLIKEEGREAFRRLNESVFEGGPGGMLEFSLVGLTGSEWIFETNLVPLRGATEALVGSLSVTRDITSRKQTEVRDAFLLSLDDATRSLSGPTEIMDAIARLLAEHLGAAGCAYADVDAASGNLYIRGEFGRDVSSVVRRHALTAFGDEFVQRLRSGRTYVIEDVEAGLHQPDALQAYRERQIAAAIWVPVVKSGTVVAAITVYQAYPRRWRAADIELVEAVANRCWESIERARIERELRESEQQFRTLANAIPHLAWMAGPDGNIFWFNNRWFEYTGGTEEEMRGWGWERVHDPAVLPSVLERWQHSIRTGEPFEMVFPIRSADGGFREFLTRAEPVRDERGRVMRWFGTNTDVTAQQEAERREKRARETAEVLNRIGSVLAAELEPERLTQKITDIATEAVRAEFGAFFRNARDESGESYLLYTLSGAPQQTFANVPMPRNTPLFEPTFRGDSVVRSDDVTADPLFGKNPPYHGLPEGHLPVRSYLAVPVKLRTGTVIGGLFFGHSSAGVFTEEAEAIAVGIAAQAAVALDNASLFDEKKRSAEALRRSNEELRRLNADLNQFAYSASHDLREPLRMVSIYTQFLSRKLRGQLDAESQKFMEHVLKGASRLEALIRDLLAYTRAGEATDAQPLVAKGNEALKTALANLSAASDEAGAKITVSGSGLPNVAIAEVHLTQILQNLIGNAIKYRNENAPEISVGATRRNDQWEFFVTDNGIGIDEDYKEHIFGIFRRLHNANEYSGTGIGLAICQRIVQRYGGRIWVESRPGRGSTFFFTLPAAD